MEGIYPRMMLAATGSGSGKTYITCGILSALKERGLSLRSFKCGPDFIDPMFHQTVLGVPSRNLDPYFTDEEKTRALFALQTEESHQETFSIIEGVMGYYDGLGGTELECSSYALARMLDCPVVLVVDCKGMSRSIAALIKGFIDYEPQQHIAGVILNRISGMLYPKMKELLEKELSIKVYGYLPEQKEFQLESRHLGLKLPAEIEDIKKKLQRLGQEVEKTVDLDGLLQLAKGAQVLSLKKHLAGSPLDLCLWKSQNEELTDENEPVCGIREPFRLGVAKDEAFCFYYEDNLRLLQHMGAELVYFSPLKDESLPDVDGLLFGGGYPELYAGELSDNRQMKAALQSAASNGMPIFAECGGCLYLQEKMTDVSGKTWSMAGILPGESFYTGKLGRFGYIELETPDGIKIKAHEFHYFDTTENGSFAHAVKPVGNRSWDCMVKQESILAGFPHLYYPSSPEWVRKNIAEPCLFHRLTEAAIR